MLKLNFNLRHQAITLLNPGTIVATDSKNYLVANFNFISDDWEYPLTAIFTSDVEKIPYTILVGQSEELEENECFIPWEVLQSSGNVYVSVFCGDLHTTNTVKFKVVKSGYTEGEIPPPPTPTIYEQVLQALDSKQPMLTAGENITIEGNVISATGGVTDYNELENKPQINGVILGGDKTLSQLKILNFKQSSDNPPTSSSELMETPCVWLNTSDKTTFYLQYVDYAQAPREYYYTWSRINNRIVVSNEAAPESTPNNTDYKYDVSDIWVQTETNSNKVKTLYICIAKERVSVDYKTWYYRYTWALLSQNSGAQIVSGVVNANGTITFTDSEDNSFTTSGESVIGADGFSPSATVQQTASGATITVTDKSGTTTANISNGAPGQDYVLTAQDKTDIANIVLGELPTTEGVLYGNQSN